MMPSPAPDPTEATTAEVQPPKMQRTSFVPSSNRVLIRPDKLVRNVGKVAIPDNVLDEGRHWSGLTVRTAEVIAVGPGLRVTYSKWIGHRDQNGTPRWPMHGLKAGDRILYRMWAGNDVVIDGEKLQVISSNMVDAFVLEDGRLDLIEDRLLVRRRKRVDRSRGGIWIPEVAQKEPLEGEVLQIGYGKIITNGTIRPFDLQVGDRVAWRPMKGVDVSAYAPDFANRVIGVRSPLRVNGEKVDEGGVFTERTEIVLLFESDLIGVIEGEEDFWPVASLNKEK